MPPRAHFLHVGNGLLEQRPRRRDDDHRHGLVDQRDRPVLHFARCITFGMDVADFLQFQRAFQGQWIVLPAAQIKHVAGRRDQVGHGRDLVVMGQGGVEAGRRFQQVLDHLGLFRPAHLAALNRHVRGERRQHGQLAGKGLGAGHADFRPGMGRQEQVRLARHRTGRHVDHHGDGLAMFLAVAQRGQRIGGLPALRNEQRQPARLQHRLAIAELGGKIDVGRQPRELLEPVRGPAPAR